MTKPVPTIIMVAPNGARKMKHDHPNLPMTKQEIVKEARACQEAGAVAIHLHIRDKHGKHTLDPFIYKDVMSAIKQELKDKLIIQITTEAVGIYKPEEQITCVQDVRPEFVSIGIREILPSTEYEVEASKFFYWMERERITPQYILYSKEDVQTFQSLTKRGLIPGGHHNVLFVLGRYSKDLTSTPDDLTPFMEVMDDFSTSITWFVCAFGSKELECMQAAIIQGGHPRIGFENNLYLREGSVAPDNAALVRQCVSSLVLTHRPAATILEARQHLLIPERNAQNAMEHV